MCVCVCVCVHVCVFLRVGFYTHVSVCTHAHANDLLSLSISFILSNAVFKYAVEGISCSRQEEKWTLTHFRIIRS